MKDKKVLFMGTPLFATVVLDALIRNTNVVGVVCQNDKIVGRKKVFKSTDVAECIKIIRDTVLERDTSPEVSPTNIV